MGSCVVEEKGFGGVALKVSYGVGKLQCGGAAVKGSCNMGELQCWRVAVLESCIVGELHCRGKIAIWGGCAVGGDRNLSKPKMAASFLSHYHFFSDLF